MKWIKKNWTLLLLIILGLLWFRECNKDPIYKEKIVTKTIKVPSVEKVFDTIIPDPKTVIIKEIDSTIYKEYLKLKDSIKRDSAYKDAITIREYNQTFEDTLQTIDVFTKTRGTLLEQSLSYKTKPQTITTTEKTYIKQSSTFAIGGELGIPTAPISIKPVFKGNLIYTSKKGNTTSISYDTEGRVWIGKTFKIF